MKCCSKSDAKACICRLFDNSAEVADNAEVAVLPRIDHDLITNSSLFLITKHVCDAFLIAFVVTVEMER